VEHASTIQNQERVTFLVDSNETLRIFHCAAAENFFRLPESSWKMLHLLWPINPESRRKLQPKAGITIGIPFFEAETSALTR
jgi:hypothetical protein